MQSQHVDTKGKSSGEGKALTELGLTKRFFRLSMIAHSKHGTAVTRRQALEVMNKLTVMMGRQPVGVDNDARSFPVADYQGASVKQLPHCLLLDSCAQVASAARKVKGDARLALDVRLAGLKMEVWRRLGVTTVGGVWEGNRY